MKKINRMNKTFSIKVRKEIFWDSNKTNKMCLNRKKEKLKEGWKADKKRKIMESLQRERSKEFG